MKSTKSGLRSVYLAAVLGLTSVLPLMATAGSSTTHDEQPTHGSIRVTQHMSESDLIKLATLSQAEASSAALAYGPGKVVETELTTENGFLVWEVKLLTEQGRETELYVDAGNGEVLAKEQEAGDREDENRGERE
jgi:uncharacterized membrane protein YkoI